MKNYYTFAKLFAQIGEGRLLQNPINSRIQAKKVFLYYSNPLPSNEIENLLKSLHYFVPNEVIQIMKKSHKFKQVFGKQEFTQYFKRQSLDSIQKADLILLCYKLNLEDDLWMKCLTMKVDELAPYYLSETMWALKNKSFELSENQEQSKKLQQEIISILPSRLNQFDFYSLSLMLQSLTKFHDVDWDDLAKAFLKLLKNSDHFSLCYGLYALAKQRSRLSITMNDWNLIQIVQNEMRNFSQNDLLLVLWALQKLNLGTQDFWNHAFTILQTQRLQTLQSIAIQSQILSQLFRVDELSWNQIEKQAISLLKSDEKSLVTLFQTFSINNKGSQQFWDKICIQILKDIKTFQLESLIKLASHSDIPQLSKDIPLDWTQLKISQRCLIFNKFARIGLQIEDKYQYILEQIDSVVGKDLVLVLYTIFRYSPKLNKEPILNQLLNSIDKLNLIDIEQLLDLKEIPQEINAKLQQLHENQKKK
ncbi:unnamed protein product (macronuclear) [Paramecium tetraurelia]|uniref:Uncharacterized protein n=1 Tax=Paramecium tetraurelia TaxID=5888 RepID=A0DD61_PARTE|nr:uncharacterized protein GSPATT00015837001 [Paramecium tetraurelia]CAK80978.1 unnamed protein product [Paramecium tetraurelia]|eukprot:XP_001448375.1 hypothetical protein (macronuclear) [Paramecium tetraurelia strain d4-2]